jgi:glycogen synthase
MPHVDVAVSVARQTRVFDFLKEGGLEAVVLLIPKKCHAPEICLLVVLNTSTHVQRGVVKNKCPAVEYQVRHFFNPNTNSTSIISVHSTLFNML